MDLCFLRVVRERVRLCFAWLCSGVGTLVVGYCCGAGVVGSGCAGVVNDPHCGGDA